MSGAHPAKTCLVDKDPPSKNRVVGLPGFPCTRTGSTSSQALQPYRESWTTDTATVSGILFWLNRDPIGEEGGINLYIFAGNNALIYYDYLGLSFWAYFHDGVRVVSGAFTVAAGGAVAAGASWTGVGAVGGIALVALGVDQLHYGAANIVNRARGRGAYAGSGIQTTYRFVSRQITGVDSSGLEVRLDEFYAAAEIASACATGYISVRSAVTAVKGAQTVRSGGRWVPVNGRIQYQFQLYGGLTWKEAGGVVATESFSVFLSGISFLEQNNNQPPSWGDGPPPSTL